MTGYGPAPTPSRTPTPRATLTPTPSPTPTPHTTLSPKGATLPVTGHSDGLAAVALGLALIAAGVGAWYLARRS